MASIYRPNGTMKGYTKGNSYYRPNGTCAPNKLYKPKTTIIYENFSNSFPLHFPRDRKAAAKWIMPTTGAGTPSSTQTAQ